MSSQTSLSHHLLIHSGERPYCCNQCNTSFRQPTVLTTHKLIHSGDKTHKCEQCYATYNQESTLNIHLSVAHKMYQSYKCTACNKIMKSRSDLNQHEKIHSGGKPFGCHKCRYKCRRKTHLNNTSRHVGKSPI